MKNVLLVIAAGLFIANCRPPAPKPEITKKPTDGNHELNPGDLAPRVETYQVIEKEQSLTDSETKKGENFTKNFLMATKSFPTEVTFQVTSPTYIINYTYGNTSKSHKNEDGSYVPCINIRKFRVFCSSFTGMPKPYPKAFKVSKAFMKVFVKRADMQTEKEVTNFTFNASTNEIEILAADLAYNANVRIEFQAAQTTLYNQRYIVPSSLEVKVNNVAEHNFNYEPSTDILTIGYPVPNNSKITLKYDGRYPERTITDIREDAANLKLVDEAGKELKFNKYPNSIQILEADFEEGKSVTLTYTSKNVNILLGHLPISGTLLASTNISGCNLGSGIELIGLELKVACPGAAAGQEVTVTYSYRFLDIQRVFVLAVREPDVGNWEVAVNNTLTDQYKRDQTTITILSPLKKGDVVEIRYQR